MCEVRLIKEKNTKESIQMLGVTVPIERIVTTATLRWYGHVLHREESNILKEALSFKMI